ncbi:MAG: DsrE family protein [Bacteroidales bacterium]|nr:DsrE family protein [Bacteroidales bacterium]
MEKDKDKLAVLWVSGDRDVAEKSCLMYTHAAKRNGWFDEVVLIVWGSSSRLLAEDAELQEKVKAMKRDGVIMEACIACANMLGVTEDLESLGIDVKGMGVPLTEYLKEGYHVLTY